MSLYKAPLEAVVESINRLNNLDLVLDQYNFSLPQFTDQYGPVANTAITLTAKGPTSAYAGSIEVGYVRQSLSSLEAQVGSLGVSVNGVTTTMDVVAALNKRYGTSLTSADIVDRALTLEEMTFPSTVNLQAVATSYGWTGSVDVSLIEGGYVLPDHLTVTALSGMNYPSPITTRPYAHMYSYWRDFTAQHDLLILVNQGTAELEQVRQALVAITGDAWVLTGTSRYSLEGAEVTEKGTTVEFPGEYNTKYERVVRVSLDDAYCLGLTGYLTLHYSQPIE